MFMRGFVHLFWLGILFFGSLGCGFTQTTLPEPIEISEQTTKIDGNLYYVHIIKRGQTAYSIAKAYNVSVSELKYKQELTQLALDDTLYVPLTKVSILDIPYGEHTVELGETLYGISRYYFLNEKDITEMNPGLTAEGLKAGTVLKIPISYRNRKLLQEVEPEPQKHVPAPTYPPKAEKKAVGSLSREIHIGLFMPLRLDKLHELSFSKFDIDAKKQMAFSSFEYLQFYEGIRIALNILEREGHNISLHVYDVDDANPGSMKQVLKSQEIENMDLLLPLVLSQPFQDIADYAKKHKIPVVNPMSTRSAMVLDNPEIYKAMCSNKGIVRTVIHYITTSYVAPHVILLHSDNKAEKSLLFSYTKALEKQQKVSWTSLATTQPADVLKALKKGKDNIVIALYDRQDTRKDEAIAAGLSSRLSLHKETSMTLFMPKDWMDHVSVNLEALQRLNAHFTHSCFGDYTNKNYISFVEEFRTHFKTEPTQAYAILGHDIILHFVRAIAEKGKDISAYPNISNHDSMINIFNFNRSAEHNGYENTHTVIYRLLDYKIIPVGQ